jgi:dienelactone hydrolase
VATTTHPPRTSGGAAQPGVDAAPIVTVATVTLAVETLAFAVLLGAAGSPGWRATRVLLALAVGALAIVVERRTRPAVRATAALLLGILGLTTGAGIGVMHVAKADVTVVAVAALGALVAGLTLVGIGAHRLWRATHGWRRLLALPLAFVLVEFVIIPVTVAIYATNVPATRLADVTPADRGLAYTDVTLVCSDGVRLSAWYVPSRNHAAVVALHGSGSTRTGVLDQSVVLARHGYGVLLLDARGHGRSGGTAMDNGWWGDRDVGAAVRWLQHRPDVDAARIGVLGMSMGGEEALGAAAGNSAISAVVTEGALWRGAMDADWLPTNVSGYIERAMLWIQTGVTEMLTDAPRPISLERAVAAIAPRPMLMIAGDPEIRGARHLRDAAPGNVELWELPDTPHVGGLSHHPAEWENRVIGFLDRTLLG